ncbi:hypothetical protein [Catalinimonas niigatensis]|uniref:hypothetical protein n=1 Tax=Catalinimonas niigatensis TaxID=1397264 RepID=UPI0026669510|nr:hypothetical protein [Catalinimonas niigatensis]WPP53241.1 hypothetical protein PZB72_12750 [Catalinimonas niigatensis]
MFITFTVFAILSVISLLIFLVESREHQRMLKLQSVTGEISILESKMKPIVITTIKGGELYETYYYVGENKDEHPKYFDQKIEDSLMKSLLTRTQMCVN